MEALRARLITKCEEAALIEAKLQRVEEEAEHLRNVLATSERSLVPGRVCAGGSSTSLERLDFQSLLQWLADSVDLSETVVFECGNGDSEVVVSGRTVSLQRMAAWRVSGSGDLKLSVPLEMQSEVASMLTDMRSRGNVEAQDVLRLSDVWDLEPAEVLPCGMGCTEPATFLINRKSRQAIVVAEWPAVEFDQTCFDPVAHFSQAPIVWPAEPSDAVSAAEPVTTGDFVEVEVDGEWCAGVLQAVDGEVANVQCDDDAPGVTTLAPLARVRPAALVRNDMFWVPQVQRWRRTRARSVS